MAKVSKPESDKEVFSVMRQYSKKKEFNFTDSKLRYLAEDCFLYWEGRKWKGISYWPAVAMRWILTNLDKQTRKHAPLPNFKGKSIRDKIIEQENMEGEGDDK